MLLLAQTKPLTAGDLLSFFLPATLILIAIAAVVFVQLRKANIVATHEEDLRRLVGRYEQLAENILDVQQRAVAELADVRTRTVAVEQILKTVE